MFSLQLAILNYINIFQNSKFSQIEDLGHTHFQPIDQPIYLWCSISMFDK